MHKPKSEAQRAASRANGQASQGPITPEGKRKSAANSLKHGLRAADPLPYLPGENPAYLPRLLESLIAEWLPDTPAEAAAVQTMAESLSHLERRQAYFFLLMEIEAAELDADDPVPQADRRRRNAEAWRHLAESSSIFEVLRRDQAHYSRQYDKALRQLLLLKKTPRPTPPESVLPNEPTSARIPNPGNNFDTPEPAPEWGWSPDLPACSTVFPNDTSAEASAKAEPISAPIPNPVNEIPAVPGAGLPAEASAKAG